MLKSINDFKQRLQEAKEYLNNPESDEELANIKNERETNYTSWKHRFLAKS